MKNIKNIFLFLLITCVLFTNCARFESPTTPDALKSTEQVAPAGSIIRQAPASPQPQSDKETSTSTSTADDFEDAIDAFTSGLSAGMMGHNPKIDYQVTYDENDSPSGSISFNDYTDNNGVIINGIMYISGDNYFGTLDFSGSIDMSVEFNVYIEDDGTLSGSVIIDGIPYDLNSYGSIY